MRWLGVRRQRATGASVLPTSQAAPTCNPASLCPTSTPGREAFSALQPRVGRPFIHATQVIKLIFQHGFPP